MNQSAFVTKLLDQYEFRAAAYTSEANPPQPPGWFLVYVKWLKDNGFEYLTYSAKTSSDPRVAYIRSEIYVRPKAQTTESDVPQ